MGLAVLKYLKEVGASSITGDFGSVRSSPNHPRHLAAEATPLWPAATESGGYQFNCISINVAYRDRCFSDRLHITPVSRDGSLDESG
jgi:hypothetical protein